jgi:hypothetical protein
MAVSSGDIIRGVWAAWRLARRDTGGMAMFDISPDGAAKSFAAAALAFPLYMIVQALLLGDRWPLLLLPVPLIVQILGFAAAWALMPAALTWILPWLDRGRRLPEAIVAYNWAALLIMIAQFVRIILDAVGLLPGTLGIVVAIAVAAACYLYEGFVLRTALEVDVPIAAGLVVFDALASELLAGWIDLVAKSSL